jgi:arsenate reductase
MEIWINPACSKCRSAISLLDAEGADYTVRRYLDDVPDEDEIRAVLDRLGLEPWDIALAEHPGLIQRPIITADDGTAVVARTEEAVRDALSR